MHSSSAASELQQLLTVPPADFAGNPHNPAAIALAALQTLRDDGDERFLFLRTLLELQGEAARQEELLFHCLTGCRHVILNKWTTYSSAFREAVRDFLLSWGIRSVLPRTIEMACYTTAASFWKRQWNDEAVVANSSTVRPEEQALMDAMRQAQPVNIQTRQELFQYIKGLLQPSQDMTSGAKFLSVLVGEFMGKSAVQYFLPLEFHKRAHGAFEQDDWLNQCLQLSMGSLSHIVSHISSGVTDEQANIALAVVQLTTDVIGWEFGTDAWDIGVPFPGSGKTLIRPPVAWRDYLIRPDFVGAVFHMHELVVRTNAQLAHGLRQLLLLLASLSGRIFSDDTQRKAFATYLVDGSLKLLSSSARIDVQETSELLDVLSLVSRLIANFKLSTLVQLPTLAPFLNAIASTGKTLLEANLKECEDVKGDVEMMENREWRDEALALLLEGAVLLCGDPWLLYAGTEESRKAAQLSLAQALGPLYNAFVICRVRMARLEEYYITAHAAELDEVREEISAVDLEEEMSSVAVIGRLNLSNSLGCLSSLFQSVIPQLRSLWDSQSVDVTPDGATVLEETRLLTMCIGHLLTDDNSGESPVIPESIVAACRGDETTTNAIAGASQSVLSLAELQASKIATNPQDPRLSPLLATSFLWFLNRWAPAYLKPANYGTAADVKPSLILATWSSEEASQQVVSFCATLSLHYQCFWPQERQVQDGAQSLILSLAKRGNNIRSQLIASPSFTVILTCHCLTAGIRHNAPPTELAAIVQSKAATMMSSIHMIQGYQRLRYEDKSSILTALLMATSDTKNETAKAMFQECLGAVHTAFSSLVQALSLKQVTASDVNAQEMACLCVELYGGVARAGEIDEPEMIPAFLTPSLPHLSGLMANYAQDLVICEGLLRFFRDYTEQFVAMLDREQSVALFTACAELLKSYSTHHVTSRVIKRPTTSSAEVEAEEEQDYSDVLCAIQLLIHLGTKDFLDICTSDSQKGVDSQQVTDVIFFGLQQIIPLMTQGLLQYPTLCTQYFALVGFMMDTYPDKVCLLPYELFDALLESLLFGMSHVDPFVSKSSLQGIAGLAREHLRTQALRQHLSSHPEILDKCAGRLLKEVVFQSIVWDRLEPCGMALLPLAAVDINRFVAVVQGLAQQVAPEHQPRLQAAFETLIQPEMIAKISSGGYEGRMNRIRFKKAFEDFAKDIHSFLVIK